MQPKRKDVLLVKKRQVRYNVHESNEQCGLRKRILRMPACVHCDK